MTEPGVQTTRPLMSPSQSSRAVTVWEQVGSVGLQPRSPPIGRLPKTGRVVSTKAPVVSQTVTKPSGAVTSRRRRNSVHTGEVTFTLGWLLAPTMVTGEPGVTMLQRKVLPVGSPP